LILKEVKDLAARYSDGIGWQSNKHAETGAGCNGGGTGSCNPDGPKSPYFHLLQNGSLNGGRYVEVWSTDVVNYPKSFDAAIAAGLYSGSPFSEVSAVESNIKSFNLEQNYPNPFNPSTVIKYELPENSFVTLKIYDALGRELQTLVNEWEQSGSHSVIFRTHNLSSGVYFYRIYAGSFNQTKKMIFLK
jgi:hypothetical protein